MAAVAVIGATGYAGGHIVEELLSRGHSATGVARNVAWPHERPGLTVRAGSIHDADLVDELAAGHDVLVVAIPAREIDGKKLIDALPTLTAAAARHSTRLGIVGGAASLRVSEDGPRLLDTPEFPEKFKPEASSHAEVLDALRHASDGLDWFYVSPAATFGAYAPGERTGSYRLGEDVLVTKDGGESEISGADYAIAFVDEIENPAHRCARFTVAH